MSIVAKALAVMRKANQSAEVSTLVETLNDIGKCNADIPRWIAKRKLIFAFYNLHNKENKCNIGGSISCQWIDCSSNKSWRTEANANVTEHPNPCIAVDENTNGAES